MKQQNRVCTKNAAVLLIAAILSLLNGSYYGGIVAAFTLRPRSIARFPKTKLFHEGSPKKLAIELLTDENRGALLRPAIDPSRPILVDAFAPWCGPCKLLDKVLKKAQPRYDGKVDFCRWNVNDKKNTAEIKSHFIEMGHTLSKLPSLILYRDGIPIAVRPGFANEFQLDDWLETSLPDVLERTFDENGFKIEPSQMKVSSETALKPKADENYLTEKQSQDVKTTSEDRRVYSPMDFRSTVLTERLRIFRKANVPSDMLEFSSEDNELAEETICTDEIKCWELLEETLGWENRTVTPAVLGLPPRVMLNETSQI